MGQWYQWFSGSSAVIQWLPGQIQCLVASGASGARVVVLVVHQWFICGSVASGAGSVAHQWLSGLVAQQWLTGLVAHRFSGSVARWYPGLRGIRGIGARATRIYAL
jgi:hypothetical protein